MTRQQGVPVANRRNETRYATHIVGGCSRGTPQPVISNDALARRHCLPLLPSASNAFIHERCDPGSRHVRGCQAVDPKTGRANVFGNRPIQVAASAEPFPIWCQSALPPADAVIWRQAVFDKDEPTGRFQNPANFGQRLRQAGDRTECPCDQDGIDRRPFDRDLLCRTLDKVRVSRLPGGYRSRSPKESGRRIQADYGVDAVNVEGKIKAGTDSDFQYPPLCASRRPSPVWRQPGRTHNGVD
jgi:hypothetical protein